MEKTRYFRSSNRLNAIVNFLSGNLFPLDDDKSLSFLATLWVICMWGVKFTYFWTGLVGSLYFAKLTAEEIFKKWAAMGVLIAEVIIPTTYLHIQRKELTILINEYNFALIDSDDLRRCIRDTLRPYKKSLKYYIFAVFCATTAWSSAPIAKITTNDRFTYEDFTVPAYVPGEPFGKNVFVAGIVFQVLGSCSIHFSKISVDFYIIHFIAVLASQYKFLGEQLARVLSNENNEKNESTIVAALHQCVRYHSAIIQTGRRLSKVLALWVGATYLTCILKFCFLAFGVVTFGSAIVETIAYVVSVLVFIVQVFLLCSSIQNLLIESTSVTEEAFHENWHARGYAVKQIFCIMAVTNQMECRVSAWRIVDLVVPTLASILSKSYSVCLLLLKVD